MMYYRDNQNGVGTLFQQIQLINPGLHGKERRLIRAEDQMHGRLFRLMLPVILYSFPLVVQAPTIMVVNAKDKIYMVILLLHCARRLVKWFGIIRWCTTIFGIMIFLLNQCWLT